MAKFKPSADALLSRYSSALERHDEAKAAATLGQFEALSRGTEAPVERLERLAHPWVSFVVLPIFALANAGVVLSGVAHHAGGARPAAARYNSRRNALWETPAPNRRPQPSRHSARPPTGR